MRVSFDPGQKNSSIILFHVSMQRFFWSALSTFVLVCSTFVLVCSFNVCSGLLNVWSGLLNVCSGLFYQRLFWSAQRLFQSALSTFVLVCSIYVCSGLLYLRLFRSALSVDHDPVFIKIFRIMINIRLKLNILILWIFFKTYYYYLTIDCWCLIKYVLQTRPLGILSFFIKENVNFIVATVVNI